MFNFVFFKAEKGRDENNGVQMRNKIKKLRG